MKIAFITDKSAPFFVGGYENRIFELARRLGRRHDVRVFTSLARHNEVIDGVRFERVCPVTFQRDMSGERSLPHSSLFAIALRRNPFEACCPDVVVVEAIPYAHLVPMRRWIHRSGAVALLDVMEAWSDYQYLRLPVVNSLARKTIRFCLTNGLDWADGILAISGATASSLIQNYRVEPRRISLIPLGLGALPPQHGSPEEARYKEYDVVTVGRLVPSKRTADLITALAKLRGRMGWSGKALIIGSGPLRSSLEAQISQLGMGQQVRMAGFVSDHEKRLLLSRSRVFVLASEREGFSLATLEAMGEGVPPIVARPALAEVFGAADFVVDQRNGMYYPVGETDALADRLHSLLTEVDTERTLSSAARATASTYTWDAIAVRFEAAIERAAAAAPSRG